MAVHPKNFQDVKTEVTDICIGGNAPEWQLEIHFLGVDGYPDEVAGNINYITVAENSANELTLDFPYVGGYKILIPSGDAPISERKVNRELQNIRERELFFLN